LKRALVTGGSGYFGEVVAKRLLARGFQVRVFDLVDNADRPKEIELVRGDIRDPAAIRAAFDWALEPFPSSRPIYGEGDAGAKIIANVLRLCRAAG